MKTKSISGLHFQNFVTLLYYITLKSTLPKNEINMISLAQATMIIGANQIKQNTNVINYARGFHNSSYL